MAILSWAIQAENSPAHAGRLVASALLNEGVVGVADGSFEVLEDTGSNLNVRVGSGTVGDLAAVQGDSQADQGVYVVESQDATDTVTLSAGDGSNPRIDLVVIRVQDDEADSGGQNETILDVVEGTPASSPSAPALPDNCLLLAEVEVGTGASSIVDANITDRRAEATPLIGPRGVLGYAETTTAQTGITSLTDLTGLSVTVDVAAGRRIKVTASVGFDQDVSSGTARGIIREGSTSLQDFAHSNMGTTDFIRGYGSAVLTPSEGSHTYKLSAQTSGGELDTLGDSTRPNFVLVEDLGAA